jgi:hypothetical protein
MKSARFLVAAGVLVAAGCAHQEHAYSFTVPEPPDAVLATAQSQLQSEGKPSTQESPTRLVTPWQWVGHEQTIQATDTGGPFVTVEDWRRYTIVAQPVDSGTKVTVREDKMTCPKNRDRWSRRYDECVRESTVSQKDQQMIRRMGRDLQARLATGGAG